MIFIINQYSNLIIILHSFFEILFLTQNLIKLKTNIPSIKYTMWIIFFITQYILGIKFYKDLKEVHYYSILILLILL